MNTYAISIKPAESAGTCEKCGNFCEIMFEVTISLGAKSQMLFLCERCSKIAKSSVDKKNSEIISKEIPKTMVTNQYTKSSQKVDDYECSSESNSKKEFNIDDTSTYYLLNTAQKKIVNDYQSVIHTSLWKEGFNAVDLIRQSNVSPDDLRTKILTRFCDVAGYYWIEGPINFSIPLDMFGYIKGKNVNEDESIYYSQRPVFTKYDNRDFGEILDTVGEALINWKSKNLLTCTMAATIFYLRSTDESVLDILMHMLVDGAKLHHDQQNQELYDCSWTLWALVAAAVDFDNRYKKIIIKHINETNTVISNNVTSQENKTSSVTARDVQKLRELTGIGMTDCKNALIEANGDINKAESILKSKGSYAYKKSNLNDVQSFSKTNRENNTHTVSQSKQINNVSPSNQNRSSNSSIDNSAVYTLKERVKFYKEVLLNLPESLEATLLLLSTYSSNVFSDFAKSHQKFSGIEKVYAFLGVRGNDDEKSRYSFYSKKYNNNLEKIADDVVKLTLNGYEEGNKNDPEMVCVCFSAIALCSNPSPSVVSILLKEVERIAEKGCYISPNCIDLWAVMSIFTGYGDGKAPFDPVDAERFRREYLPSLQNDSSNINNRNSSEFNTDESDSNFYSKKGTKSNNEKSVLFFGQFGHGKSTLLTAIKKVLSAEGVELEIYDNSGFSFVKNSEQYLFKECPDITQNIIPFIKNSGVQCDCAVMVISTISGPMQETKEQLNLIRQLGVKELVVYMSMTDKADDPELIELVEMEIRETIAEYGFDADDTVILNGSPLSVLHEILNLNF